MNPVSLFWRRLQESCLRKPALVEKVSALGRLSGLGEYDLILYGKPTHIKQRFIVAKTKQQALSLANLTQDEAKIVTQLAYFSLHDIIHSNEIIYSIPLPDYLPDIIAGKYPRDPIEINLS